MHFVMGITVLIFLGFVFRFTLLKSSFRSSHPCSVEVNPAGIHEHVGSIPGVGQWVKNLALPKKRKNE